MTRREIRRFPATDESGNRYIIIEYETTQDSNEIRTDRMRSEPVKGKLFETADGRAVEEIGENRFQILGTDKIVRKV